jgi:hypothetical protein
VRSASPVLLRNSTHPADPVEIVQENLHLPVFQRRAHGLTAGNSCEISGYAGNSEGEACRFGTLPSVAAVRTPPPFGDEALLKLEPPLVGLRGGRKRFVTLGAFRL